MLHPIRSSRAFTLIEMLVVMAVIAILAGIILSVNGLVQGKAARARAEGEIKALSAGCEAYKGDNGSYPQDNTTDGLDPRSKGSPTDYQNASKVLYRALSGDTNTSGRVDATDGKYDISGNLITPTPQNPAPPTNYLPDFFQPNRLSGSPAAGPFTSVSFIKDPYGNSYGYSTKGAAAEQKYRIEVTKDASKARPTGEGFNTTFDLWSTAGKNTNPIAGDLGRPKDITNVWIKNW